MTTHDNWIKFIEVEHCIKSDIWQKRQLTFDSYTLTIPIFDQDGSLLYAKKRREPAYIGPNKYLNAANTPITLYPLDILADALTIVLCEGELDALTLASFDIAAVTSTGGAMSFKDEFVIKFKGKQVIICFDNDEKGREGAERTAKMLAMAGIEVRVADLPTEDGIKDIGDYFRAGHTKQEFLALCQQARVIESTDYAAKPQQFTINDFQVDVTNPTTIVLGRDNLVYKFHYLKGYTADIGLYRDKKLLNRERFALNSGKGRASFVNRCTNIEADLKVTIANHLIEMIDVLDELLKRQVEEADTNEEALTDEEVLEAKERLQSPTLLFDVSSVIKKAGVVGEEENALAHYLTFTSRLLDDLISETVKGESSAGKSYVPMIVMKIIPTSAYIDLTDATPQSFFYADKDHFAHKIIIIFEKHGQEKADYSIRSFQSEKKLKLQVTVKDPKTGQFMAQERTVDGPVGFITTTTDARIHSENETRVLSLYPDESREQTERIFAVINAKYLGTAGLPEDEIKLWQHVQQVLEPYSIVIPFAIHLSKIFPKEPIRVRRDYDKLLALIAAITLLHQEQRQKQTINDKEYLIATLADFHIAKTLFEGIFQKTIFELPPKSQLLVTKAKELYQNTITVRELGGSLGWDYDTAKKWFDPAFRKGYFSLVEEHKGAKAATYQPTDKELTDRQILPNTEDLYEINPDWLGDATVYDPLTGEIFKFQEQVISTDVPTEVEGQ